MRADRGLADEGATPSVPDLPGFFRLRFPMPTIRSRLLFSGLLLWTLTARADVTLAPLFRDGAVLQQGKPVPVLTTALYERFASRGEADYQDKLLSAMRFGFGGHVEMPQ